MRDLQFRNFITLISAYINNRYVGINLVNPDWEKIYKIAETHNLTGLIYLSVEKGNFCDNKDLLNKFRMSFLMTVNRAVVQESAAQKLIDILNAEKIRHIIFKGNILKYYYPDKEIRTMGDIDIVIDKTNQKKVYENLTANGFNFDKINSHNNVGNYIYNNTCFEIHTSIIEINLFKDIDYIEYFNNCFNNAVKCDNYTYEFNKEFHFIYLISHMAKHFKTSGCGVKMFIDIALFTNKFKDMADWTYIEKELKKLKLYNFTVFVFSLCNIWFGSYNPYIQINKDLNEIEYYIISGGAFGYENRNIDAIAINQVDGSAFGKFVNIIKLIFPSYEHLNKRYVWAKNIPRILLPLGWIKYWWFRLVILHENGLLRVKNAFLNSDDAIKHINIIKQIGLSDDQ